MCVMWPVVCVMWYGGAWCVMCVVQCDVCGVCAWVHGVVSCEHVVSVEMIVCFPGTGSSRLGFPDFTTSKGFDNT